MSLVPLVLVLVLAGAPDRAAATDAAAGLDPRTPLAIVNEDTLQLDDLEFELYLMEKQGRPTRDPGTLPAPDAILRRMIQNALLVQEGYRMGMAERPVVRNQVQETIRHRSVVALVDSIAFTVPADTPDLAEARWAAIRGFVDGLIEKYHVEVDSTLLRSLDYASGDPEEVARLRESEDVLANVPTGSLRVRSLTRNLRMQEFHGLEGRPDADAVRDRFFEEWLHEALLSHEAAVLGVTERPDIRRLAAQHERDLILEETLGVLADIRFAPADDEIAAYHRDHLEDFTPPARLKVESVMFASEEPAQRFEERLRQGARLGWLAERTPEIVPDVTPFPRTWLQPRMLGLAAGEAEAGQVLERFEVPGGWVVAVVSEVEAVTPTPLAECRQQVLTAMQSRRVGEAVADALARLEEASDVRTLPGAEETIRSYLAQREEGQP
jgi:hypothetical protein